MKRAKKLPQLVKKRQRSVVGPCVRTSAYCSYMSSQQKQKMSNTSQFVNIQRC